MVSIFMRYARRGWKLVSLGCKNDELENVTYERAKNGLKVEQARNREETKADNYCFIYLRGTALVRPVVRSWCRSEAQHG